MRPRLLLLAALLCATGFILLAFAARKTVHIRIDGTTQTITGWFFTPAHTLAQAGITFSEGDFISPPLDAPLAAGSAIEIRRARWVILVADGKTASVWSAEPRPENLLALGEIALFPGDEYALQEDPLRIEVRRAQRVTLLTPQGARPLWSTAPSVGAALKESGIPWDSSDHLQPPYNSPLENGMTIEWLPAQPVTVELAGQVIHSKAAGATVGAALMHIGLPLQGLDFSIPPEDAPLPADGKIRLVQVREAVTLAQTPLPFETEYRPLPNVPLDTQQILAAGAYGVRAQRVRTRYEDGVQTAQVTEAEWVARVPQNRVVGLGSKIEPLTLQTPDGTITYWRAVTVYATAYSPCRLGIPGRCNEITASGRKLQKGVVAVTRAWYGYFAGTQVYVPGYGVGVVADVGAGVSGKYWVDLGFSEDDFVGWARSAMLYFLWPPPANPPLLLP